MSKEGYPTIDPREILDQGNNDSREIGRIADYDIAHTVAIVEDSQRQTWDEKYTRKSNAEELETEDAAIRAIGDRAMRHLPGIASDYRKNQLRVAVKTAYLDEQMSLRAKADREAERVLTEFQDGLPKK